MASPRSKVIAVRSGVLATLLRLVYKSGSFRRFIPVHRYSAYVALFNKIQRPVPLGLRVYEYGRDEHLPYLFFSVSLMGERTESTARAAFLSSLFAAADASSSGMILAQSAWEMADTAKAECQKMQFHVFYFVSFLKN